MTKLDAKNMPAKELCARIRESTDTALAVEHVNGQRYIAAGLGKKELTLTGTPGNALGAYLNGTRITVLGNAQDATGDTMNDGAIFVLPVMPPATPCAAGKSTCGATRATVRASI